MHIERVIEKIVSLSSEASTLDRKMKEAGYQNTPYWSLSCKAMDVIFAITGEDAEEIENSATYKIINSEELTDREKVYYLLTAFYLNA